jgi:Gram-negative porin
LPGFFAIAGFAATAHTADLDLGSLKDPLPDSLTWHGVTLYGTIDIGYAYQTNGRPLGSVVSGLEFIPFTTTRNYTGQSNADSGRCGQAFNGVAYAGVSNPAYGTLTAGRQNSPQLDGIGTYDPMSLSYAFSLLGYSGTNGGSGTTQSARWDNSVKYVYQYGPAHAAAMVSGGVPDTGMFGTGYAFNVGDQLPFRLHWLWVDSETNSARLGAVQDPLPRRINARTIDLRGLIYRPKDPTTLSARQLILARNVACAAGASACPLDRFMHRAKHVWMPSHAKIVAGAPDGDRALSPSLMDGVELNMRNDPIVSLGPLSFESLAKHPPVIHWLTCWQTPSTSKRHTKMLALLPHNAPPRRFRRGRGF